MYAEVDYFVPCLEELLSRFLSYLWPRMWPYIIEVRFYECLPGDVCCVELIRRANVNDRNAFLLGKQQLLSRSHLHLERGE